MMNNFNENCTTGGGFTQQIENLPAEILDQPRFFPVAENKQPLMSEWQKPENQRDYRDVRGLLGFDTCGHGQAADYLFVDFDHVLDDAGNFSYPDAERWYNYISQSGDNVYCERSKSGDGLHFICRPTAGKFPKVTNSDRNRIYFDKETGAKIELFYLNAARKFIATSPNDTHFARKHERRLSLSSLRIIIQSVRSEYAAGGFDRRPCSL